MDDSWKSRGGKRGKKIGKQGHHNISSIIEEQDRWSNSQFKKFLPSQVDFTKIHKITAKYCAKHNDIEITVYTHMEDYEIGGHIHISSKSLANFHQKKKFFYTTKGHMWVTGVFDNQAVVLLKHFEQMISVLNSVLTENMMQVIVAIWKNQQTSPQDIWSSDS